MDDGDDDLPAQPRAGQAARVAARAARHPAGRPQRRPDQPPLPARRAGTRAREDRGRHDRDRHRAHGERGVDRLPGRRGLRDPGRPAGRLRAPARRPGEERRRGGRRREAQRRRPARVREPAGGRRRALRRLRGVARAPAGRGRRRRLAGARRGRQPGGPAAALGGLAGRRAVARGGGARGPHRRLQLRLGHGAARAAAALGGPADGRAPPALAALPDRRQDPARRGRDDLHAAAGDLLAHRRPGRRAAAGHARLAGPAGDPRRLRRHAEPDVPAAQRAAAEAAGGRDAGGPGPRVRRLGTLGAARRLRRLHRVRPPLQPRPGLRRRRVRPGDPRDGRRLDPVRRRPAEGRRAALHPLPLRRRADGQRHRRAR